MAFQQGLSGLNSASKNLDVISNNVANAATVGFKGSRTVFADVFANSLNGSGASQVGIGSKVAAVSQEFGQGNVTSTNNPLDVAINGNGFFRLSKDGAVTFSRNGQFHLDPAGYLVNTENQRVTGYGADASGNIIATSPVEVQLQTADIPPLATTTFRFGANLDAGSAQPTAATFSTADPASYNNTTSGSVYDTLGNAHVLSYYFVKTATAGQWNVHASVDDTAIGNVDLGAGAGNPLALDFDSNGALTTTMPVNAALTIGGGATTPINFALDMASMTQFGSPFSVNSMFQDGYSSGRLVGLNIGSDGTIKGRYTNGQSQDLAQMALAQFANPNGLKPLGQNQWSDSPDSGLPVIGTPGSGNLGAVQSSAVEDSNVDLTAELVNMITAQRIYQANAQSIKTQDEVMQTLVNLR
ncbi:MAG: flagellar hook-basal body complex protein [Betaproteobacteria bacterium]|nr:flagellar hook-basal body complex protein [Betaproteobacteria bacterium]